MSLNAQSTEAATHSPTLTVLRSNGIKDEMTCSLEATTLRDFKSLISKSNVLGKVPIDQQRIFHYGRELKTLGRSLHTLGVGRFTNHNHNDNKKASPKIVIHLHAIPQSAASSTSHVVPVPATTTQRRTTPSTGPRTSRTAAGTSNVPIRDHPELVDLYSNDDDDDNVVVANKPPTSTTTTAGTTTTANQPQHSNKRRRI